MRNILFKLFVIVFVSTSLISCSTNTQKQNTGIGVASGAVIGGLAGSLVGAGTGQAVAIGVGIVAGALIGGYVGKSMDSTDNAHVSTVLDKNPTNKPATWKNKKTGNRYMVKPTSKTMTMNGHQNCRTYTSSVTTPDGKKQTTTGTACRQNNGTWQNVQA